MLQSRLVIEPDTRLLRGIPKFAKHGCPISPKFRDAEAIRAFRVANPSSEHQGQHLPSLKPLKNVAQNSYGRYQPEGIVSKLGVWLL